jgi:nitrite reductase/ring-hydroxylating ferredoxin subunit
MKVSLCSVEEIPMEGIIRVDFFGREVLVFNLEGKPKAILNPWAHLGDPMRPEGDRPICEWHGADFDSRRGTRIKGLARPESGLMILPTRVEDGALVYVYEE